jgi:hypothetical protein
VRSGLRLLHASAQMLMRIAYRETQWLADIAQSLI